jgi:hypothetical protein
MLQAFVSSKSSIKIKFQPTNEELGSSIFYTGNELLDLNADRLHVSASGWSEAHLTALRVIVIDNVGHSRLYPSKYWSEINKGCYLGSALTLCVVSQNTLLPATPYFSPLRTFLPN